MRRFLYTLMLMPVVGGSAGAEEFRFSTAQSSLNPNFTEAMVPFTDAVRSATDGSVDFTLFPAGQLSSTAGSLSALGNGTADAALIVSNTVASDLRAINGLAQMMFTGENQVAVAGATAETILLNCPQCEEEMEMNGAMSMAPYSLAPYYLMCTAAVPSFESLQGRRIRMAASVQKPLLDAMGATGLLVPAPETFEALERGQLDCTISPLSWLSTYSLQDVAKYVVDLPLGMFRGMDAFALSTEAWERMNEAGQQAVLDNLPDLIARNVIVGSIQEDERVRQEVDQYGVQFIEADEEFRAAVDRVIEIEPELVMEEGGRRGVPGFNEVLQAHLQALDKWERLAQEIDNDVDRFSDALRAEVFDKLDR